VIHCGKQLATAEGRIVGSDGKLYARATTTGLVFEMAKLRFNHPSFFGRF
jgi:acyl-coenzyme A thioesterase PaaI-like protein